MNLVRFVPAAFLLVYATVCAGCSDTAHEPVSESVIGSGSKPASELLLRERKLGVMGTDLSITALHEDADLLERALDAAVLEIQRVEDLMTDWRPSPLITLNQAAGAGPHKVPTELASLIDRGLAVSELSDGSFDLTFRTFGRLWDFKADPPQLPLVARRARYGEPDLYGRGAERGAGPRGCGGLSPRCPALADRLS